MARVYSRASETIDIADRARPAVERHSMHESREAQVDRDEPLRRETSADKWINPSNLDAPPARSGFVQRWIADGSVSGSSNEKVWLKKLREGWSPRDPSTIPQGQRVGFPTVKLSGGQDVIRVAGLILCEMPRQVAMQRHQAVNDLINRQSKSMPESIEELSRRGRAAKLGELEITDEESALRGRKSATMVD